MGSCTYILENFSKWGNIYTKADSWFQNSYEKFGKLQTSRGKSKKLKFNGLHLSKKSIPSAKTLCTEDLSNITFNYCEISSNYWCHFWNHKSFFTTQLVCVFLAQTIHTFDRNIPSKCTFSDFPLLELKFTTWCHFSKKKSVFLQSLDHFQCHER